MCKVAVVIVMPSYGNTPSEKITEQGIQRGYRKEILSLFAEKGKKICIKFFNEKSQFDSKKIFDNKEVETVIFIDLSEIEINSIKEKITKHNKTIKKYLTKEEYKKDPQQIVAA